jgi:outer membrane protein assembly factor BamB
MKKWMVVLLVFGAALMASGDSLISVAWDNLVQRGGPQKRNDATSVALHHNRAVVGAVLGRPESSETDVVIRGFNLTTGALAWTDEFAGFDIVVEAAHDFAIAVASIPSPDTDHRKVFIRNYDLHSGAIRWTRDANLFSLQKILLRNGKLVIIGSDPALGPITQPSENGRILVLDTSTGLLLWNATIDFPESAIHLWDVDDAGRNIIVVGTKDTFGTDPLPRDLIVRSYRLRDGELQWEFTEPGRIVATQIRVVNEMVVVSGSEEGRGFLAAYRASDGILQWKAATPSVPLFFFRLAVTDTKSAVTPTAVFVGAFNFIGAFNAGTGEVLWSKSESLATPETVNRLIPIGANLVTVGTKQMNPPLGPQQLVIRVLDATTGDVVAEDLRETGPGNAYADATFLGHGVDAGHDVRNGRFAVVGHLGGIAGGALVRVYDVQIGIQP